VNISPSSTPPTSQAAPPAILSPHYGVALGVVGLGLACLSLSPLLGWAPLLSLVISLFGLFLLLQTALLRLEFNREALQVWRQETLLRRFPYGQWQSWRLFWPGLPVLFYFREERSIHLLPMLFNAAELRQQLEQRLPALAPASGNPAESGHPQG
jgi:hypothetical protein